METLAEPFLLQVPASERAKLIAEVEADSAEVLCDGDGRWFVDYVRLRFRALKPQ